MYTDYIVFWYLATKKLLKMIYRNKNMVVCTGQCKNIKPNVCYDYACKARNPSLRQVGQNSCYKNYITGSLNFYFFFFPRRTFDTGKRRKVVWRLQNGIRVSTGTFFRSPAGNLRRRCEKTRRRSYTLYRPPTDKIQSRQINERIYE